MEGRSRKLLQTKKLQKLAPHFAANFFVVEQPPASVADLCNLTLRASVCEADATGSLVGPTPLPVRCEVLVALGAVLCAK